MNEEQKKNLIKTIEESDEWQRIDTSIDGLYVVKPPEYNNNQAVFVELRPTINGQAPKRRGLYLKSIDDFEAYKKLCDGKVYEGIAYTDRYGRIVSVKLKEIPKVIFSARMFDFL